MNDPEQKEVSRDDVVILFGLFERAAYSAKIAPESGQNKFGHDFLDKCLEEVGTMNPLVRKIMRAGLATNFYNEPIRLSTLFDGEFVNHVSFKGSTLK